MKQMEETRPAIARWMRVIVAVFAILGFTTACHKNGAQAGPENAGQAADPEVIQTSVEGDDGGDDHGIVVSQQIHEWNGCDAYEDCCWAFADMLTDQAKKESIRTECDQIHEIRMQPDADGACNASMGSLVPAVESWAEAQGSDLPEACM